MNRVVIIFISFCVSVFGQNNTQTLQEATSYFNEVQFHDLTSYTPTLVNTPTVFTQQYYKVTSHKTALLHSKALAAKRDLGLSLISSARYSGKGIALEDLEFNNDMADNNDS